MYPLHRSGFVRICDSGSVFSGTFVAEERKHTTNTLRTPLTHTVRISSEINPTDGFLCCGYIYVRVCSAENRRINVKCRTKIFLC